MMQPPEHSQPMVDECWCGGTGKLRPVRGDYYTYRVILRQDGTEEHNWCPCPTSEAMAEAYFAKRETERLATLSDNLFDMWISKANIPPRFGSIPESLYELFGTSEDPREDKKTIMEWDKTSLALPIKTKFQQAAQEQTSQSWFLWGPYGTGKTAAMVLYARDYLTAYTDTGTRAPTILFRSVPRLLMELRATYSRKPDDPTESDVLDRFLRTDLLLLDDLGAEQIKDSGWVEDRLYQVIGERHADMTPIIFTSNLSLDQLAQRIGERIVWRIVEMCGDDGIVEVKGKNLRDTKRQK